MRTRKLGNTDLELSVIGLGTWAIGGSWQFGWGRQDESESVHTICTAVDQGINWIDTAPIYGCGDSEEVLGKALKEMSHRPMVATKCSLLWNSKRQKYSCLDFKSIITECENSLKRLHVDVIDLYQMHWPSPEHQIEEAWQAMVKLIEQGKVRYIGVSNFQVDQLERIAGIYAPASLQPPYSMLRRDIEDEILPFCTQKNIGVIVYSPMQKGLLTGKFSQEYMNSLADDDHRLKDPNFTGPGLQENLAIIEALSPIAKRNNCTMAQMAIAWVLRDESVTAAIVGARKPHQIQETVLASDLKLSDHDIQEIESVL